MAANTSPLFTLTPACTTIAGTATANASRTVFATGFDIITGGTNGTRVEGVQFQAVQTTTAGMIRVWHRVGASDFLIAELPVSALTASGTAGAFQTLWKPLVGPFVLKSGEKLAFTTHNAEAFNATPIAGDY